MLRESNSWRWKVEWWFPGLGEQKDGEWFNWYKISVLKDEESSGDGWWLMSTQQ
jgi:hypothetical protein